MKHSLFFIISIVALSSCGNPTIPTDDQTDKRSEFIIQTKDLGHFTDAITRETSATINAGSTLSLTAESSGKVGKIHFREGQFVKAGTTIISLEDSTNNFDITVAQARNNLTLQEASTETNRIALENAVTSAQMAYDRAKLAYETLKNKTDIQYDTLVKQNRDTIKSYDDAYRNFLIEADRSMTQYLNEADKIIGASLTYEGLNERWEPYLWSYAWNSFKEAKEKWDGLYTMRAEVRKRLEDKTTLAESDIQHDIDILVRANTQIREFADAMIYMLQNSHTNDYLTEAMKSGWTASWNGYRSAIAGSESQFVSWKTPARTFLENYKQTELATRVAVKWLDAPLNSTEFNEIQWNNDLRIDYQNIRLSLQENRDNAKLTMENAEISLQNAKKTRDATIRQLQASTEGARLSLLQAERNAQRLAVTAPISGIITKIHAEIGQTVNPGSTLAEFVWDDPQARIEIDPRTALMLHIWDAVTAEVSEQFLTGSISSISSIAGSNLLSSIRVVFPNASQFIGQPARITFDIPTSSTLSWRYLVPINAVSILAEGEWRIYTYQDGRIHDIDVRLGNMYGKGIEVITDMDPSTRIITSDIALYNENEYILREDSQDTPPLSVNE